MYKRIKKTDLSDGIWNATAIQLGRIQVEFQALYTNKPRDIQTDELLRICYREELPYKCFEYLERALITEKAPQ